MYTVSEKVPNLQEWTPAEWLSVGGVLYLVWALLITDKLSLAEEKLARYDELNQKVATTLEQIKELNRALAAEKNGLLSNYTNPISKRSGRFGKPIIKTRA